MDPLKFLDRFDHWPAWADRGIRLAVILLLAWLLSAVARKLLVGIYRVISNQGYVHDEKRAETLSRTFRWTVNVVITVIAGMLILNELGVSIAPLLAGAGVAGIAVGFGAQSLVKDFFSGFFILLENQVRVGDWVEIGGKAGLVEDVTLRYIRLREVDGTVHFVPNGSISIISNRSRGFVMSVVEIGISYNNNVDQAVTIMKQVAAELRGEPEWAEVVLDDMHVLGVDKLADSAVVLKALVKCVPLKEGQVRRELLRRIKQRFDREGIEIPFPQMTVHRTGPAA